MITTRVCKHCGRHRKDHGKVNARCPNPAGRTWTVFEESERGADTDGYADRTVGGGDFNGTEDYNERVMRDDANHHKHVARVLREEGA